MIKTEKVEMVKLAKKKAPAKEASLRITEAPASTPLISDEEARNIHRAFMRDYMRERRRKEKEANK